MNFSPCVMKRRQTWRSIAWCGLLVAHSATAPAHHSYSTWAPNLMTVAGTVKEYQYTSPHIWIQVLVPETDGSQVEWGFETGSPASMKSSGWTPKLLQVGDKVQISFHPKRDGTRAGSVVELDLPDGKVMKMRDLVVGRPDSPPP